MKNPYFRAVSADGTKVDINLNSVSYFSENTNGGTTLVFNNGLTLSIVESAQTVRGRTRKAWPDQTTTTDHIVDGPAGA